MLEKEKIDTAQHIVFLGEAGFPIGLAPIERITLMGRALHNAGCKVTVICRKGVWKKSEATSFKKQGTHEGIDYIYTSKSVFRPAGFINRNLQKLTGLYREFQYLRSLKQQDKIDLAILSDMKVIHVIRYLFYASILNFPLVVNFVEMASSMQHRTGIITRINDHIYDRWMIRFFNGALPISNKLMDFYRRKSPSKPCLKLPVLCDFDKFDLVKSSDEPPYFLYCGSIRYKQVRDFIIEAYKSVSPNTTTQLYMIISGGSAHETEQLQKEVAAVGGGFAIRVFSNIPYDQLVQLYINAVALLIPLRNTVQDAARFPHKIGEYLASANPVITTNVGEIKNYLEDGKTALIADTYSETEFADKMQFVLDHPQEAKMIGISGKTLGLEAFHYKVHGKRLQNFLQNLQNRT